MKNLCTFLFFFLFNLTVKAQCSSFGISVSSSTVTSVQLYNAGFFFMPSGQANVCNWLITNFAGATVHQTTTSGTFNQLSFMLFNHSVPTTDSMKVELVITNPISGLVCTIRDTLRWDGPINNWRILHSNVGSLPVELLDFEGFLEKDQVFLNWKTASEINNEGFEIERLVKGQDWKKIGFQQGKSNSVETNSYHFLDKNPPNGTLYYRLKQIDFDGQFEYSSVVAIRNESFNARLQLFPNPSHGEVSLRVDNPFRKEVQAQVFDVQGRIVWSSSLNLADDIWNESLHINTNGVYIVRLQIGNEILQQKFVVQQ